MRGTVWKKKKLKEKSRSRRAFAEEKKMEGGRNWLVPKEGRGKTVELWNTSELEGRTKGDRGGKLNSEICKMRQSKWIYCFHRHER